MPIKRLLFYLLLLISPFLLMVVVNETNKTKRHTIHLFKEKKPYYLARNPESSKTTQCTWHCHTKVCSHPKRNCISVGPVDTLRQKIIDSLNVSNGDAYQTNNILFLVILWPVLMFGLVVANVELFIRRTKKT